ncbi:MAG: c-type cytochrome, partial [Vicinamibacterales bacterium]
LRWSFHTIPHPGEPGYETWPTDAWTYSGSANNWAGMAVDTARGLVYVPTGSAAADFYGANRLGDNLFANTLLALDAETGKRVWHFQAVRHDIWDRDFPSPPTLVTVTHDNQRIDAVAQATKHGVLFLFDRQTGRPLFPIEERAMPASTVDGEQTAATQPFPIRPAPYSRQRLTEDLLTTRTPDAHRWALEQFRAFRSEGQFVPFSVGRETFVFPGFDGGAEWGGSAVDPSTGVIYINANDIPWSSSLRPSPPTASLGRQTYVTQCASCHGDQLQGGSGFPGLQDLKARRTAAEVTAVVRTGQGRMPPFSALPAQSLSAVVDYVLSGEAKETLGNAPSPTEQKYAFTGYHKFLDPDGYPAVAPPWGTLNAINLNTGEYAWKVPLGEYPELVAKGLKDTGSENYGGPIVTAGGLLFIGATNFDRKLRAFDKDTGTRLWETTLINSANSTPATYEVNGTQYVVVAAFGGYPRPVPQPSGRAGGAAGGRGRGAAPQPNVGAGEPSGGAFVAFKLGRPD